MFAQKKANIGNSLSLYTHAHYCNSHTSYNTIITAATATDLIIGTVDGWLD